MESRPGFISTELRKNLVEGSFSTFLKKKWLMKALTYPNQCAIKHQQYCSENGRVTKEMRFWDVSEKSTVWKPNRIGKICTQLEHGSRGTTGACSSLQPPLLLVLLSLLRTDSALFEKQGAQKIKPQTPAPEAAFKPGENAVKLSFSYLQQSHR